VTQQHDLARPVADDADGVAGLVNASVVEAAPAHLVA
jgi:hypothetical protein